MSLALSSADQMDGRMTDRELEYMERWRQTILQAIEEKDLASIVNLNDALRSAAKLVGIQLAEFLYLLKSGWPSLDSDETFEEFAEYKLGYSVQTVTKYTGTWEVIFEQDRISEERKQLLIGYPIGALYLLKAAIQDGDLTEEHWAQIEQATTKQEVRNVVRQARGEQTSSSAALRIRMDSRGIVSSKRGDGEWYVVGKLETETGIREINDAIDRIVRSAGVLI